MEIALRGMCILCHVSIGKRFANNIESYREVFPKNLIKFMHRKLKFLALFRFSIIFLQTTKSGIQFTAVISRHVVKQNVTRISEHMI